jgi:ABC-type multidrug transport system ATPase subunit
VYRGQDGNADKIAVRGISLSMSRGQCLGVLGPNGAGKTTLINMVSLNICQDLITLCYIKQVSTRRPSFI